MFTMDDMLAIVRPHNDKLIAEGRLEVANREIARLRRENWQLKGTLGYPVPGDIPPGDFKCGLCEARALTSAHGHHLENEMETAMRAPSDWAKATAFNVITRHPDCFQDDYALQELIDDIALALDSARKFGMEEVSREWFTLNPSTRE